MRRREFVLGSAAALTAASIPYLVGSGLLAVAAVVGAGLAWVAILRELGVDARRSWAAMFMQGQLGKYIPGNPTVVATNMPGAGQMLVANWLANVAPKDGTAIVALSQNMAVHQATGAAGVRYDVRQFHWICNTTDTPNIINAWHTTGIQTIQDVMQR